MTFRKIIRPIELFFAIESCSSILLFATMGLALFLANSSWSENYFHFIHFEFFGLSVLHWINDGLMAIFFFLVGMEIKREVVQGELSSIKKATLPIAGAIGGMMGPALLYYFFNPSPPAVQGWGIPMATDIAFALGVLSFFGKRVPFSLKIFLLALAIVDDLGAVLIIAFFYTKNIYLEFLTSGALLLIAMEAMKRIGIKKKIFYVFLGAIIWFCFFKSGVHATIAGVLIGLITPLQITDGTNPLEKLTGLLHPWVSYGIMPIFALVNSGVALATTDSSLFFHPIFKGITLGLAVGKPLGILLASSLAVLTGLTTLPRGVNWQQMLGVSCLGGIGFTMSLFISSLALSTDLEVFSKSGILMGSFLSAALGAGLLAFALPRIVNKKATLA